MGIQKMHAFSVKAPYVSASEPNLCDPRDAPWFMIGFPHLDGQGLSVSWFLKEAGHLHYSALAEYAGRSLNELKDVQGRRALPGVVACVVTGHPDKFEEDDVVELQLRQRPNPLNGWRSVTQLSSTDGTELTVEIVTGFAVLGGPSNHTLEAASMSSELVAERGTSTSRRTDHIRRMGSIARRDGEADMTPRNLSINVSPHMHFNGSGLMCYSAANDLIVASECNSLQIHETEAHFESRRMHYFGNLDANDMLDISTKGATEMVDGHESLVATSYARRRSDGLIIGVCESVYRV